MPMVFKLDKRLLFIPIEAPIKNKRNTSPTNCSFEFNRTVFLLRFAIEPISMPIIKKNRTWVNLIPPFSAKVLIIVAFNTSVVQFSVFI